MSTHNEDWVDFTHTTRTSKVSAHELFERYREFRGFIAGLSRKELVARHWLKTVDDDSPLAQIFHKGGERNGGGGVRRLDSIEPNENTPHRHSAHRL